MGHTARKIVVSTFAMFGVFALSLIVSQRYYPLASVAAAPGASREMVRLQKFYLGTWDYTETYEKTPSAPRAGVNTGVYKSELGPGGNSLINHFHSQGPVGDYEGLLIMTWAPKEKAYEAYIFGNDFPGGIVETGNFEGETLVFRAEMTIGDRKFSMRNSTQMDEKGKMTSDEFLAAGGAPERLFVRILATRKP